MDSGQPLNFFDELILYEIKQYGTLRDWELAQRLQCPRTVLLQRLEQLLRREFLTFNREGNQLFLTGKGLAACPALEHFYSASGDISAFEPEGFDWTALYIPEPGWPDR